MCWDCYSNKGGDPYKVFRQGGVEASDFDEEVRYRHAPRKKKKERDKAHPGCPGNDMGPHVYVWTTERELDNFFSNHYGFHKMQTLACIGCPKYKKRKESDRYAEIKNRKYTKMYGDGTNVPRGEPVPRWGRNYLPSYSYWAWENYDEDYVEKRKAYMQRHGFPQYLWRSI